MRAETEIDYAERITRVLLHIQGNLDAPLDLERLAAIAHFSPFHFHRVFSGMVGESVKRHVRRLRLERAAMRLKHARQPVTRIALEAGYQSHEAFTRAFRSLFGLSPTQFRAATDPVARAGAQARVRYAPDGSVAGFASIGPNDVPVDVEIRELAPMRAAFIRHVGPYDEVGSTWEQLIDWVGRECSFGPRLRFFGACWDDPEVTPARSLRYDACVTVDDDVTAAGAVGVQRVAGGRFAVALHEGPYRGLAASYAKLCGLWFPASGERLGDPPSLEFYLDDPESTPPEELLTEVWMRIAD